MNTDDRDVVKYLKYFTFLTKERIDELAVKVETEPHKREAQKSISGRNDEIRSWRGSIVASCENYSGVI